MMLNAELDVLRAEKLESQKESEKMIEELKEHVLTLEKKAESSQEGRMNRMSLPDINPSWSISSIEPSNGSTASVESKRLDQPSKTPKQEEEMEIDNTWMEEEIDSKSEDEDSEYEPDVNIKKPKSSKRRKVPKPLLPKGQTSQEANVLDEIDNLLDDGAPTKLLSLPEPLEDCKVAQLKAVLKSHGMAVSGKKDILIQRLRNQNYQILWLSGSIPELPLGVEAMEDMLQRRDEFLRLKEEGKLSEVCPIESSMVQDSQPLENNKTKKQSTKADLQALQPKDNKKKRKDKTKADTDPMEIDEASPKNKRQQKKGSSSGESEDVLVHTKTTRRNQKKIERQEELALKSAIKESLREAADDDETSIPGGCTTSTLPNAPESDSNEEKPTTTSKKRIRNVKVKLEAMRRSRRSSTANKKGFYNESRMSDVVWAGKGSKKDPIILER
mmetsp:Transcript_19087/g.24061  ORF Transcript_19087/g.24061 Transcript_19087/m.24061 type:complete len:443 (-) Transcript_19087:148-1476(-)